MEVTQYRIYFNLNSIHVKKMIDQTYKRTLETKQVGTTLNEQTVFETERLRVKPRIGLAAAVAFVVGSVIGSGIFISPIGALENSGSVGLSLVIWAVGGIFSMLLGLVYAELGVILPKSGGDYVIIREGIGDIPAFLVAWTQCVITQSGTRAVLALVFADYVCVPIFGACKAPDSIRKSIAASKLLFLAICNTVSVNFVSSIQGLFTIMKVCALIVITIGGIIHLSKGETESFANSFEGSTTDVTRIALAIYSCMWAYGGYNNLNEIAEELVNPKQNILKAIVISLTLVTIIYLTTNVSYFTVLPKPDFLDASAVAYATAERVLGSAAIFIPISVMFSVYGASNGGFFTDVRVRFAAARCGHLPEVLSFLHHKTRIPLASLVFNTAVPLILLIPADISELINLVSFVAFFSQTLTVISLLRFRYQRRNLPRDKNAFRLSLVVPILALLICLFMFIAPFVNNPRIEFVYGVAFIFSGLILYVPFVYFEKKIPGFDKVTMAAQLLMRICPTVLDKDLDIGK